MTTAHTTPTDPDPVESGPTSSTAPGLLGSPVRSGRQGPRGSRRQPMIWGLAVLGLVGLVVVVVVALNDGDDQPTSAPLVLSVGEGEASASCLPFDVEILAAMSRAFAGTVTAIEADTITVRVDDWYVGGDASTVELRTIGDAQALLGGFPLDVGAQYLLSASDDALSYCGYSGPVTPELQESFDVAFGGRS